MDNGAIVHIDYDLFEVDSDRLIETTREDVAKEHDIFDENRGIHADDHCSRRWQVDHRLRSITISGRIR